MAISIKQIPNGKWKENCYVVNNLDNDALIIDPGGDEKRIIGFIENNNLNVCAIINTHAHYDHIGAITKVKEKFSIPFFLHSKDEKLLKSANLYTMVFEGSGVMKIPDVDYYFDQIDIKDYLASFSIKVICTPGHTWGSVCFLIENCLFTGDALFNGKIGRVDLPGGDEETLNNSLKVISKLPKETNIYPGHGRSSTIGYELEFNSSFIRALTN
jgi:glyoxylase-like metal-dependent hydrolase (beta-lactamase superfamily II)